MPNASPSTSQTVAKRVAINDHRSTTMEYSPPPINAIKRNRLGAHTNARLPGLLGCRCIPKPTLHQRTLNANVPRPRRQRGIGYSG
jgi:hypothetical protein